MKNRGSVIGLLLIILFSGNSFLLRAQGDTQNLNIRKAKNGIYVVAHRGAHTGIPENSLAAYRKAIELGCDFVEIDVRTTKDGKFVSIHNPKVETDGSGLFKKVSDMTFAEIKAIDIGSRFGAEYKGTQIPSLQEILDLCKGKIGIYLDLKDAPVSDLSEIIKSYGMERDVFWYIPSFCIKKSRQLGKFCPDCILMPDPGPESNISDALRNTNIAVLATDMRHLNEKFVKTARQHNAIIIVDDNESTEAEWSGIINLEVNGIQTDRPEELISFLKKQKLK